MTNYQTQAKHVETLTEDSAADDFVIEDLDNPLDEGDVETFPDDAFDEGIELWTEDWASDADKCMETLTEDIGAEDLVIDDLDNPLDEGDVEILTDDVFDEGIDICTDD